MNITNTKIIKKIAGRSMKPRILVVEDCHDLTELIAMVLEDLAIEIEFVSDGSVALNLIRTLEFSAIICDCELLVVSGPEFLRDKISMGIVAPTIMISAHQEYQKICNEIGATHFCYKLNSNFLLNLRTAVERIVSRWR